MSGIITLNLWAFYVDLRFLMKSGNREVVWDAGPAGDWHPAPDDYTVGGLHPGEFSWYACVPRNYDHIRVLTVALKWESVAAGLDFIKTILRTRVSFLLDLEEAGKRCDEQPHSRLSERNKNHNRMCRPFQFGI